MLSFLDLDDEISRSEATLKACEPRKFRHNTEHFKCFYSSTKIQYNDRPENEKVGLVIVAENVQRNVERVELFSNLFFVYDAHLFYKQELVGPVGQGIVSLAADRELVYTISDSHICVYNFVKGQLIVEVPAREIMVRCIANIFLLSSQQNASDLLITCSNGLIYYCEFSMNELKFELLFFLPESVFYKYDLVSQASQQTISNVGSNDECSILTSYYESGQEVILFDYNVKTGEMQMKYESSTEKFVNETFANDCEIVERGELIDYESKLDIHFIEALTKYRNIYLSYVYAVIIMLIHIMRNFNKRSSCYFECARLLALEQRPFIAKYYEDKKIYVVSASETTVKDHDLHSKFIIPNLTLEVEQLDEKENYCEMELAYSFYKQNNALEQRNSLLSSMSCNKSEPEFEFISIYANQKQLVVEFVGQSNNVQEITYESEYPIYENQQFSLNNKSTNVDYYNPFEQEGVFDFKEINFVFLTTEGFRTEYNIGEIQEYLFLENDICCTTISDDQILFYNFYFEEPSEVLLKAIQEEDALEKEFQYLVNNGEIVTSKLLHETKESQQIFLENDQLVCYFINELFEYDSRLFLNQEVFDYLMGRQPNHYYLLLALFEGIRQIGDFEIYMDKYREIINMLKEIFEELLATDGNETEEFLEVLLIIDEFQIQLELLNYFYSNDSHQSNFVNALIQKEQQFLTGEEYCEIYDSKFIRMLTVLLNEHTNIAIYPNMPFNGFEEFSYANVITRISIFDYYEFLIEQPDQCIYELKMVELLSFIDELTELLNNGRVTTDTEFLESALFSSTDNITKKFYRLLSQQANVELLSNEEYQEILKSILILYCRIEVNNAKELADSAFKHNLLSIIDEIPKTKDKEFNKSIMEYKEYIEFLLYEETYISFLEYPKVPPIDKLNAYICGARLPFKDINIELFVECNEELQINKLISQLIDTVTDYEYLDEFEADLLTGLQHLDNIVEIAKHIYSHQKSHYSKNYITLLHALELVIKVDPLAFVFLQNEQQFSTSILSEDNIINIEEEFIDEQNLTMMAKMFEFHEKILLPELCLLIKYSIEKRNSVVIKYFEEQYLIPYLYCTIVVRRAPDNTWFEQVLNLVPEKGQEVYTMILQLELLWSEFNEEEVYQAACKFFLNLPSISNEQESITELLELIPQITNEILLLNSLLKISDIEKLRILISLEEHDVEQLFLLSEQYVNEDRFIFTSYEEVIQSDLYELMCEVVNNENLRPNYKMVKLLFERENFDITVMESQVESHYYIPTMTLAATVEYVGANFNRISITDKQSIIPISEVPKSLRYQYLVEFPKEDNDIHKIESIYLLYYYYDQSINELIDKELLQLQEELLELSVAKKANEIVYEYLIKNVSSEQASKLFLKLQNINCAIIEEYFKPILTDQYLMELYGRYQYEPADALLESKSMLNSVTITEDSDSQLEIEQIQEISESHKNVNVYSLLLQLQKKNYIVDIVISLLQHPIVDLSNNITLQSYGQKENLDWESSSEQEKNEAHGWESSSESSDKTTGEKEQEESVFEGQLKNKFFSNQAEMLIYDVLEGKLGEVDRNLIISTPVLSPSLKISLLQLTDESTITQMLAETIIFEYGLTKENIIDAEAEISLLLENKQIISQFDPYYDCLGVEADAGKILNEILVSCEVEPGPGTIEFLFILSQEFSCQFLKEIPILSILMDKNYLRDAAVESCISRLVRSKIDYQFILQKGCIIQKRLIAKAFYYEQTELEEYSLQDALSDEEQIKFAYALTEEEIAILLDSYVDELQPVKLFKIEYLLIMLKQLNKLPQMAEKIISAQLAFIYSNFQVIQTDGEYVYVDFEHLKILYDFLAFSDQFKGIKGDLRVKQFESAYNEEKKEVEIAIIRAKKHKPRILKLW